MIVNQKEVEAAIELYMARSNINEDEITYRYAGWKASNVLHNQDSEYIVGLILGEIDYIEGVGDVAKELAGVLENDHDSADSYVAIERFFSRNL